MLTTPRQLSELVNLFHQGVKLTYNKGEFLIRPGDSPSGVFYISSGVVKAYDITKYGEENLLIIRKRGEILGLTWALTGDDRHIIYSALAPTTVFMIKREQFVDYLRERPSAALPLLDMLVDMYRMHSERILNLEYRTVRERLVSFLIITADRFGQKGPQGVTISVPLRHQDIASSISATRETTSREMSHLERQELIASDHGCIVLRDIEKLRQYLQ